MNHWCRPTRISSQRGGLLKTARRWLSAEVWQKKVARPVQTYISTSRDPYVNLSIEHDALVRSAKDSVLLFLYINRPSVIIGRNQNPWLEVNLPLLNPGHSRPETEPAGLGIVDLVRRRSGGGTVFHDEGNVNWTVICPRDQFTRDKHAEMIVRALRSCGVDRSRVNERHDIVLDSGKRIADANSDDTHVTPYTNAQDDAPRPLKVSGSAYKITGAQRALHHGTCLLSSPNLQVIPHYLHSPAKPYIKEARGVQSVSSPVSNILLSTEDFIDAVNEEFSRMYQGIGISAMEEIGDEMTQIKSIADGVEELKSPKYKYEWTPQFMLSNAADKNARMLLELVIREGRVTKGSLARRNSHDAEPSTFEIQEDSLLPKLHQLDGSTMSTWNDAWEDELRQSLMNVASEDRKEVMAWLRRVPAMLTAS